MSWTSKSALPAAVVAAAAAVTSYALYRALRCYRPQRTSLVTLRLPGAPTRRQLLAAAEAHAADGMISVAPGRATKYALVLDAPLARRICESKAFVRELSMYRRYWPFLDGSLLLLEGAPHDAARLALAPLFGLSHLRASLPTLSECCNELVHELLDLQAAHPLGCVPEPTVLRALQGFALSAASRTLLGHNFSKRHRQVLIALFEELLEHAQLSDTDGLGYEGWSTFRTLAQRLERIVGQAVDSQLACATRSQRGQPPGAEPPVTLCSLLLVQRDGGASQGEAALRAQAVAHATGLLFAALNAGTELLALVSALARGGGAPEAELAAVRAEVRSGVIDGRVSFEQLVLSGPPIFASAPAPAEHLAQRHQPLRHLGALVLEVLRLHPGISHVRLTATRDVHVLLGGYPRREPAPRPLMHVPGSCSERLHTFRRGDAVVVSPWLLHHVPTHWAPPAAALRLGRHLQAGAHEAATAAAEAPAGVEAEVGRGDASHVDQRAGTEAASSPAANWLLPFSAGPKRCPASRLALAQMQLLGIALLQACEAIERVRAVGLAAETGDADAAASWAEPDEFGTAPVASEQSDGEQHVLQPPLATDSHHTTAGTGRFSGLTVRAALRFRRQPDGMCVMTLRAGAAAS